jgi:hypothetical protein
VGLDDFEVPEAIDDRTVRFTAKQVHWRNLGTAGGLTILPKHDHGRSGLQQNPVFLSGGFRSVSFR